MTPLYLTKRQVRIWNRLRAEVLANALLLAKEPDLYPVATRIRVAVREVDDAIKPAHIEGTESVPA